MFIPREYQLTAHASTVGYLQNAGGVPIVAMPTGTGKSINIAMLAIEALNMGMGRVVMGTHVKELVQQNAARLRAAWPEAPMSIFSAGLGVKDLSGAIVYGGIASIRSAVEKLGKVSLFIIDECHLLSPNADAMYRQVLAALWQINPAMRVVGYTGTPYRMGQGLLTNPKDDIAPIFTDFAVNMTTMEWFNWFISQAYLSNLVSMATHTVLDVSGVSTSGGEFKQSELTAKLNGQDKEHLAALKEAISRGADRRKWLVFTAGVERADWVADMLNTMGVPSASVTSFTTDRDEKIEDFRNGRKYRAMVGNNIFTTGFDDPEIDLIVMLRPTKSTPLWVQMLGRGTRPLYAPGYDMLSLEGRYRSMQAGGKRNCLVLDFAKNTPSLGPVNDPRVPDLKGSGGGDIPLKVCPACGAYNFIAARQCAYCNAPFDMQGQRLTAEAYAGEIVRTVEPKMDWFKVNTVIYSVHRKQGGKPCVHVSYECGLRSFNEYLFPEHGTYQAKKARDWWRTRLIDPNNLALGTPPTADEFVKYKHLLRWPKKIEVHMNHEPYPEVTHYEYE